jgi:hypothetical protein
MSGSQNQDVTELVTAQVRRADQECDRFEAAWKAGRRPRVEDHVAAVPESERPALLHELIGLEVDYRRLGGEHLQAEEFLGRFPGVDHNWIVGVVSGTGTPTPLLATQIGPPAGEPVDALIGRRIGPYVIEQLLGHGGMGTVYRAVRADAYQQLVAVKVIRPGLDSAEMLQRFRTERQVLAELPHPYIARLLDGGATDDGRPYFVMEYIDGEPLNQYCERRRLGTRERVELLCAVCAAVQHAHERQVVHRDLKPGNVLVTADGTPKVTDFGLAKRLEDHGGGSSPTHTGAILGTPSYMAPEQAGGVTKQIGPAADIYALGAILYELLTRRPPFKAATPLDTVMQVLCAEPVPPSRLHPRLARDLETICLKCLEKEPAKRYPSVTALAEDLRRFLAGEPIRARRVGRVERVWRWCRRHPARALAATCALLALVIAGFLGHLIYQQRVELLAEKRRIAEERALLAAMAGDADGAAKAIRDAERLGASPGQMHLLRGQVAFHRGEVAAGRDHLEQAVRLMPDSVAARAILAVAYYQCGQGSRFDQVSRKLDQMTPRTPEDFLFKGQAECINRPERALQTLDEAIKRRNSIISRAVRLEVRAGYALFTDDLQVAQQALEDAQAAKAMLPGNPVALSRSVHAHLVAAAVFDKRGQPKASKDALDQAGRDAAALEPFAAVPPALMARFHYFDQVGNEPAAFAVSAQAIEFRHAPMLYRRWHFRKALKAADRSLARGYGMAQIERGFILLELPDGPRLARQATREAAAQADAGLAPLYAPMILLLLGRKFEAVEASWKLRRHPALVPPWHQGWYHRHLDFLCGRMTGEQLLQTAGRCRPKLCEAHFVIGLSRLCAGDRAGARLHFQKCAATRVFIYWDYVWARAFLERLHKDRTWPPWIAAKK